jgi:hypothetical protein
MNNGIEGAEVKHRAYERLARYLRKVEMSESEFESNKYQGNSVVDKDHCSFFQIDKLKISENEFYLENYIFIAQL